MYLVFFQMAKDISVATEDNLREYTKEFSEETRPNPFFVFFYNMSIAVTTRAAHIPGTASAVRDPMPDSDLSDSADEDKSEVIPNTCLVAMFIGILSPSSVSDLGGGFSLAACVLSYYVSVVQF
jgi:hypothetical protein